MQIKFRKPDRVGRRGLFEPGGIFSRLHTLCSNTVAVYVAVSVEHPLACPAVEKFCRASSAGGRLNLQIKFRKPDRVGRRGLFEPGGIFSRLHTYASIPSLYPSLYPSLIVAQCNDWIFAARNNRGIHTEDQSNCRRNSKADNN